MDYPNYKNKHHNAGLFSPADFLKYHSRDDREFPQKYILIYDPGLFKRVTGKYSPVKLPGVVPGADIYQLDQIGIARMKGIGAPHAAAALEEIIALGGNEFINIGTAGGLKSRGTFLCIKALRDEGTSHHYLNPEKFSYPDEKLTERLAESIQQSGVEFQLAPSWTTDAPYRETREEVDLYKKEGIATVEMEAAALFAVACFRKVKIAAAFIVSDILAEEWKPEFHHVDIKAGLDQLFIAALECLTG